MNTRNGSNNEHNPTLATGARAAGEVLAKITNAFSIETSDSERVPLTAILSTITITCKDNIVTPMEILFFKKNPTSGTYTVGSAISLPDADLDLLFCKISIASADFITINSKKIFTISSLHIPMFVDVKTDQVCAVVIAAGSFTTATADAFGYKFLGNLY